MKQNETRFCVFCGNAPMDNNPEHVLPTWLLKMTGDPKRTASFGWDYQQEKERKFAFSSFVFPACKSCNEEYSQLETAAGPILTELCNDSAITVMDADKILDWFDKVRIGLWLGFHILDRNIFGLDPMFHIENRVARKDRMLFITHFLDKKKKLTLLGTDSGVFRFMPSCFGLLVNGTLFLNASSDFMIAARTGFPYPKEASVDTDTMLLSATCWDIANKVKTPIIRFPFLPYRLKVFQPILPPEGSAFRHQIESCLLDADRKGPILVEHQYEVEKLKDPDALIQSKYFPVHRSPVCWEYLADILGFQRYLIDSVKFSGKDNQRIKDIRKFYKAASLDCGLRISHLKSNATAHAKSLQNES